MKEKVIAVTTVSQGWKISINKDVRDILEEKDTKLKIGDKLMYVLNVKGEVVLRRTKFP